MRLSESFEAVAYKQLVSVDLPGRSSHQHELNGVSSLKYVFGTGSSTSALVHWVYFSSDGPSAESESEVKFYDARAKSSARTGRSEWRLYYRGNFLEKAQVGDLFILARTKSDQWVGMIFQRTSKAYTEAIDLFGLDVTTSFDSVSTASLEIRSWDFEKAPTLVEWFKIPKEIAAASEDPVPSKIEAAEENGTEEEFPANEDELRSGVFAFKPRARMLVLLGDQLIRDAGIAVFELVKNAYDADATEVLVTLSHVTDRHRGIVIVEDDGCGMNWSQIVNVWLEPGTDYRHQQKVTGYRTPRFNRLPLGEKGVGRFAAHKLGKAITLITRQRRSAEVVVRVNWSEFLAEKYLSNAMVSVTEREPKHFTGDSTGTRIEISELNDELTRGTIRQIQRSINSVSSPFRSPTDFGAFLEVIPKGASLEGLLEVDKILELAPYRATCLIENGVLTYDYEFLPPDGLDRIKGRKVCDKRMAIPKSEDSEAWNLTEKIGSVLIEARIFDLDTQTLQYSVSDKKGFKEFLRHNGGVRVYRDGVRVYDYGEPGNDWLDLGGSRVNQPSGRISNNQVIGAVHLEGSNSAALIEKTNREGFIEDATYEAFREAVLFALTQIVFERNQDKQRMRNIYASKTLKQPVVGELANLRDIIKRFPDVSEELLPIVEAAESQFVEMRDTLITAAGAGLTLTIVIHEVEKAIKGLYLAVEREANLDELKELAIHLNELVDGLTYLTRKSGRRSESFAFLAKQSIVNTNHRTTAHRINVLNRVGNEDSDMMVICSRRLIIATLMNLIDNSIYWLDVKGDRYPKICIGASNDLPGGPVLYVADNGPGFQDAPEHLVQPFMTRRPEGMGLGLHLADLIMKTHDGRLIFPEAADLGIPEEFSGAIVGLQFKGL